MAHCKFVVTAGELPVGFISVTVTETMDCTLPVTVNGIVKLNWLPNAADAELRYQVLKSDVAGTVTEVVCSVEPAAAVKVNTA